MPLAVLLALIVSSGGGDIDAAAPAHAPRVAAPLSLAQGRWVEIGKTRSGNPVFVDQKSVKTAKDGIVSATIRVAYLAPVKTPKGNVTASRALAMFDCKASTFATKENAMYIEEKTNNIFQRTVNAKPGFGPAIGGNFADVALKHFCKK